MSVKEPPAPAMAKDKAAKTSSKKKDASIKPTKPSKSAKSTSKSSQLSEARIAESDSENEAATAPKKPTTKASKDTRSAPTSTPKKESTKKSTAKAHAVSPPSSNSDESSSEEEVVNLVPKKPDVVPAKVNGVKRKAEEKESSEEKSSGSDSDDAAAKPQAKKAKTTPAKAASPTSTDDEESSEESEEEEKPAAATNTDTSRDKQPGVTAQPQSSLQTIPAKPFEPPVGFSSLDIHDPDSAPHLSKKSLAGKEIWHIAAPSNVPITSITEVALDAVSNGTSVLNYKHVDYVLKEDKSYDTQFSNVLLPGDDGYKHAGQKIERTLRLQQKIELPKLSKKQADLHTGSNAAADVAQPPVSDIRPQPKGLKMRYKPPGFGKGDPGMMSESSEDEGERIKGGGFQFPKALGAHGAADEPETAVAEKSKMKDEKRRKRENLIDGDVEMVHGASMPPPSKKKKKKQEDALERVVSKESERSQEKEGETPEERARRKEQKRLRKEARKQAKQSETGVETAL